MTAEEGCARETDYGFGWGPVEVTRLATIKGTRVIGVYVEGKGKPELTIYVSPTGRSVRVFRKGKGELTAGDAS